MRPSMARKVEQSMTFSMLDGYGHVSIVHKETRSYFVINEPPQYTLDVEVFQQDLREEEGQSDHIMTACVEVAS